jgi:hypothetical protein
MKRNYLLTLFTILTLISSAQIISQYVETSSGSIPKGIEIWNNTPATLNFGSNNLVIEKGTNGASPSPDFTLSTGTLASGSAIVIGTSDMQTVAETNGSVFHLKAFTFNGDDALVVKYGGIITDVFGVPGSDPGTAWSGSGVSTANQNIALKEGIEIGDTDGWSDPSERFETVTTDNSLSGFGIAPILISGTITVAPLTLNNFIYVFQNGPSTSQFFNISGTDLSSDVIITPPVNYEISTNNSSFQSSPVTLSATAGTLTEMPIFVRLKAGLTIGSYNNETIGITSTGVVSVSVNCFGRVFYRYDMELPNGWINEFHYDNDGIDENESIEIVIENTALFNLSDFTLLLYNGGDGTVYESQTLNSFTTGTHRDGFSFYTWQPNAFQNGSPDGLALAYKGELIQFISYEGAFAATDGPAAGFISTDIGAEESSTKTLITTSLQLIGTGNQYSHFRWTTNHYSPGIRNIYQYFGLYAPPVPIDYRAVITVFLLIGLTVSFKFTSTRLSGERRKGARRFN